jgi:hypothetical protein
MSATPHAIGLIVAKRFSHPLHATLFHSLASHRTIDSSEARVFCFSLGHLEK